MKLQGLFMGAAVLGGVISEGYFIKKRQEKEISGIKNRIDILTDHFQLLNHWLEIKHEGKNLSSYFEDMGYQHIAIYGMAELGNRLFEELSESSVSVDYGIDRDVCCTMARIDNVYSPEDKLPETDVVVVTPYSSYDSIKEILEKKISCPIISLEEIVWSV